MSRAKAVEWLFWHREREKWEGLFMHPQSAVDRDYYRTLISPTPGRDDCWTKWVLG